MFGFILIGSPKYAICLCGARETAQKSDDSCCNCISRTDLPEKNNLLPLKKLELGNSYFLLEMDIFFVKFYGKWVHLNYAEMLLCTLLFCMNFVFPSTCMYFPPLLSTSAFDS